MHGDVSPLHSTRRIVTENRLSFISVFVEYAPREQLSVSILAIEGFQSNGNEAAGGKRGKLQRTRGGCETVDNERVSRVSIRHFDDARPHA